MATRSFLAELTVDNVAIVEHLRIEFAPGFTVLTGETGAGKSIIIDALEVLLGDRAGPETIRAGCERARLEGLFELGEDEAAAGVRLLLEEHGIERSDGLLVISRELTPARTVSRLNGQTVALSLLQRIGRELVDIHAQSDHQSLLRPARQLLLLDRFAGLEADRAAFTRLFRELQQLRRRRDELMAGARERERRLDTLRFEIEEIDGVGIQAGEDERLAQERTLLANAERLAELSVAAATALGGGDSDTPGAETGLASAVASLAELSRIDPALLAEAEALAAVLEQVREIARSLRGYAENVEFNAERLDEVQARLNLLARLRRKYGESLEEVIAYGQRAAAELAALDQSDEELARLAGEEARLLASLAPLALAFSERRRAAGAKLGGQIAARLSELGMPRAQMEVAVTPLETGEALAREENLRLWCDQYGADRVELLFSANAGEAPRPLARIASGGEVARTMLAIKSVLAAADTIPTIVFDEVETGVGGRLGGVVAKRLAELSRASQVLAVTHLPQVAARADIHLQVVKSQDVKTGVAVRGLRDGDRLRELAEMLGGAPPSQGSLRAAEEMLAGGGAAGG